MAIPVLPLDKMSIEEKLQTMETIWASLSANLEAIESPAWHEEELRVREARVASGEAKFVDWEKGERRNPATNLVRIARADLWRPTTDPTAARVLTSAR